MQLESDTSDKKFDIVKAKTSNFCGIKSVLITKLNKKPAKKLQNKTIK